MVAGSSTGRPDRDQDQVDADVAATRDRLVSAVEALVDRVHPQRIKQREVAGAKRFAHVELENLRLLVFNAAGDLRRERLAKAGSGAAGFLGFLLVLRGLVRRGRRGARKDSRPAPGTPAPGTSAPAAPAPGAPSAVAPSSGSSPKGSRGEESGSSQAAKRVRGSGRRGPAAPEVQVAPATSRRLKPRPDAAPVGTDDVEARVRRARKKA